jgi:hypothetical protein
MSVLLHLPQRIEGEKLRRVAGSELWESMGHWAPFTSSLFLDAFFRTPGVRLIHWPFGPVFSLWIGYHGLRNGLFPQLGIYLHSRCFDW